MEYSSVSLLAFFAVNAAAAESHYDADAAQREQLLARVEGKMRVCINKPLPRWDYRGARDSDILIANVATFCGNPYRGILEQLLHMSGKQVYGYLQQIARERLTRIPGVVLDRK